MSDTKESPNINEALVALQEATKHIDRQTDAIGQYNQAMAEGNGPLVGVAISNFMTHTARANIATVEGIALLAQALTGEE